MMLFLDTSDSEQTAIYLLDKKSIKAHVWNSKRIQAETLHSELRKFLKEAKTGLTKIEKIGVVVGPGHFSRIRNGVVTANTFAYALKIPVVGVKKFGTSINFKSAMAQNGKKSVDVFYDRKPNITMPKEKR